MIKLTKWCGSDLENGEHYVIIIDAVGKYLEYKVRCLHNSPNCTIVGHLEYDEDFLVYTLFATENLPLERFIILRRIDTTYYDGKNYCEGREEVDIDYVERKARARAKDIKFKF